MDQLQTPYLDHFSEYGCNFFRIGAEGIEGLNSMEEQLLQCMGLPDSAIPYFYFDFFLSELRDVKIDDAVMVLGTAFEAAGFHYLYLSKDHSVKVLLSDGDTVFVNSSLEQFMRSIFHYSIWLEDIEEKAFDSVLHELSSEDVFNLFYSLRGIDAKCVSEETLWNYILHTEVKIESVVLE